MQEFTLNIIPAVRFLSCRAHTYLISLNTLGELLSTITVLVYIHTSSAPKFSAFTLVSALGLLLFFLNFPFYVALFLSYLILLCYMLVIQASIFCELYIIIHHHLFSIRFLNDSLLLEFFVESRSPDQCCPTEMFVLPQFLYLHYPILSL